ncbi:hypothetical protein J1614_003334 [Plenodomus biglobosus]|nr:hypothetical protein J1614_003334 [Plenodomus biglobosus]
MLKVPTQTTKRGPQIPDQRSRQESALQVPRAFLKNPNRDITSEDEDNVSVEETSGDDTKSIQSAASTDNTSISDLILNGMVNSQFHNTRDNQFLPNDDLVKIFDKQFWRKRGGRSLRLVIAEAMRLGPSAEVDSLVQFILAHAKVVFLIAVHTRPVKLHEVMALFQRKEFTDKMLPVEEIPAGSSRPEKHPFMLMQQDLQVKVWEWSEIQGFQENQRKFFAPCITTEEAHHDFGNRILPFDWVGKDRAPGGQSLVYQYQIHKAHFDDSSRPVRSCLNRLNIIDIVRFITAFSHGIGPNLEYFLVFEWASGGNLRDLWKNFSHKHENLNRTFVKDAMTQLKGLADALCAAHYLRDDQNVLSGASYRHGDLKPENILWFRNSGEFGTLKIGDWGEAKSHTEVTAIRPHDTDAGRATVRYEPPEVQTGIKFNGSGSSRNLRSRLFDLWGFGCIALEMVVWLMYGYAGLDKFNSCANGTYGHSETFWELNDTKQAVVHGAVNHWMDHMAKEPRCCINRSALGNLLQTIRRGLLVVKLPSDGGLWSSSVQAPRSTSGTQDPVVIITAAQNIDEEPLNNQDPDELRRYRAFELADDLAFILSADDTKAYWNQPCPQTRPPEYLGYSSRNTVVSQNVVGHLVPAGVSSFTRGGIDYQHPELKPADWTLRLDNHFAEQFVRFNTLKWVEHCDDTHKCNGTHQMPKDSLNEPSVSQRSTTSMPTRLIDVGTKDDAFVYLRSMKVEDEGEWIALSYRWGGLGSFSTTHSTIRLREEGMEVQKLPATFRDAVKITRALNRRYLGIDSICILQGADGDFDREAARMEDVYSGAYCVIAATCATNQDSGFLRPRKKRDYVSLSLESEVDGILYLCRSIDNFNEHVLKSDHSRRGWVLQEHALARRSIFFTEYQTYWQCGHGVRCETMTNMTK